MFARARWLRGRAFTSEFNPSSKPGVFITEKNKFASLETYGKVNTVVEIKHKKESE